MERDEELIASIIKNAENRAQEAADETASVRRELTEPTGGAGNSGIAASRNENLKQFPKLDRYKKKFRRQ